MAEQEEKSSSFCFTIQASCMDVSRGRKQTTESGQCHPRYKGKHCETRKRCDYSRKFCLRRCQTKYMTIKCYEDAGNFQLRNPFITYFWRWMRTVVFKFAYSFNLFFSVLTGVWRLINPSRSDVISFSATRGLYYNQPGHSCKDIRDSGFFKKDGEYWIDPEKNGKPIKVYCDMTTDGGKKYFGK